MKVFAENNFDVAQLVQFFSDRIENIVRKRENAGCQRFLLFVHCFQKTSFSGLLKVSIMGKKVLKVPGGGGGEGGYDVSQGS